MLIVLYYLCLLVAGLACLASFMFMYLAANKPTDVDKLLDIMRYVQKHGELSIAHWPTNVSFGKKEFREIIEWALKKGVRQEIISKGIKTELFRFMFDNEQLELEIIDGDKSTAVLYKTSRRTKPK